MTGEGRAPERVIARLRPHARALFLPSLALIAVTGGATYLAVTLDELWMRLVALGTALLLATLLWLLPYLRWLNTQYVVTSRRVVLSWGLFVRTRSEVLLSRSHDVTVRRSGLQGLFRSGDVLLNTGLDRPIVLRDVPRANLVQRALADVMETATTSIAVVRRPVDDGDDGPRRDRSGR